MNIKDVINSFSFGSICPRLYYYVYFFTLQACNLEGWLYIKTCILNVHDYSYLKRTVIDLTLKHSYFLLPKESWIYRLRRNCFEARNSSPKEKLLWFHSAPSISTHMPHITHFLKISNINLEMWAAVNRKTTYICFLNVE